MAFLNSKRRKLPLSGIGRAKIKKLGGAFVVFAGACVFGRRRRRTILWTCRDELQFIRT